MADCVRSWQIPSDFLAQATATTTLESRDSHPKIPNLKALLPKVPPDASHRRQNMSSVASSFQGEGSNGARTLADSVPPNIIKRRVRQRRQTFAFQVGSGTLNTLVVLVYAYAGTVSMVVPSVYFLSGIVLIGFFLVLSETRFNDRFEDHYLTIFQFAGHIALQLGLLLACPSIGYAFLSVLFLIFGMGSLRMTSRQAAIAWTLTLAGLAPIFLLTNAPIGLPVGTGTERLAAMLCFVLTIGQCAYVGLYGSWMRKMLYNRSSELKAAYKRIEELAELDELTGSFNRRCIMRMLEDEVARSHRVNAPCSIALIDLDWFKRINDGFGHPTGDEVLRTFAITVFANIRSIDKFGRYGGEEFLLVLPDTPGDAAARILDRLRAIVADLDWSAFSPAMQVTISAGVATLRPDENPDTLLARADNALYDAKGRGRNRIAAA
jgi:diguanylate cyclase (GGDEF)-like protein